MALRNTRKVCLVGVVSAGALLFAIASSAPFSSGAAARPPEQVAPRPNYREFQHSTKAHQAECATCHKFPSSNWKSVRSESEAFPDISEYPTHDSCIKCHQTQFFRGRPPAICTICHTTPGPRISNRHPFPNPREVFDKSPKGQRAPDSDFEIGFPHATHVDIVSAHGARRGPFRNASLDTRSVGEESCAVCHKTYGPQGDSKIEYFTAAPANLGDRFWLKKGTFKTTPTGHATCFTCHSEDSGIEPAPTKCGQCHKLRQAGPAADFDAKIATQMKVTDKIALTQWRQRLSSGTYRHEFEIHASMECATCHTVATMNTLDHKTKKVPIASCATCHATSTVADGGALNIEVEKRTRDVRFQCVKCHVSYGKLPIPASHRKALEDAK